MQLIDKPIDSIGTPPGFEGDLFVLHYADGNKYAMVQCHQYDPEVKHNVAEPGLAVFPSENQAMRFSEHMGNAVEGEAKQVSYDEARETAMSKNLKALALVEDADPKRVMVQWIG